jgi:hypothetical protein
VSDGSIVLSKEVTQMDISNYTFVVNNEGEVFDKENGVEFYTMGNYQPDLIKHFNGWLRRDYEMAQQLTPMQWMLYQRWRQVSEMVFRVTGYGPIRTWATINDDGVPHLWLSCEFIVSSDEQRGVVEAYAEEIGGICWLLIEDPLEDGSSMQYSVDVDVLGLEDDEVIVKLADASRLAKEAFEAVKVLEQEGR